MLGGHSGVTGLSVAAWAEEQDDAEVATALFTVPGGAGVVDSWAYGLRRWPVTAIDQLALEVMAAHAYGAPCTSRCMVALASTWPWRGLSGWS